MFPAMAQEGQQPVPPTEDHGAHHGGTDQSAGQQSPSGGMMGQGQGGMMGQRQGGMMDQDGKPDGCPMMGDMMGSGRHGMGMKHGMMHSVPMMEARLAYIKADLEITDAQSTLWDAYADAVRARRGAMESVHADMMKAKESGTVVERMDARIKALESMVDSLKALKPATEALYAALSEEQKKKADQLLGAGCGMR
jgi:hypothetical protein